MYLIMYVASVARFRDAAYHVFEEKMVFTVVIQKIGCSADELTAIIRYNPESATTCKKLQ